MKSLTVFCHVVLDELGTMCHVSTLRDYKTVAKRIEDEGISFLTITLPAFAKDFEEGLEHGRIGDNHFAGFSKDGKLPKFLGGFLANVFDASTGVSLLDMSDQATYFRKVVDGQSELPAEQAAIVKRLADVDWVRTVDSIRAIRQFTLMFAKIKLPTSDVRNSQALANYLSVERYNKELTASFLDDRDLTKISLRAMKRLEKFFGEERFLGLMVKFITAVLEAGIFPDTDLVPLLTDLEVTLSSISTSGPKG